MPPLVQILACGFALLMAYMTYVDLRRHLHRASSFLIWEALWLGLAVVTLVPGILEPLARPLRVARLLDLVVVLGTLFLAAAAYRSQVTIGRLQRQMEKLVRQLALEKVDQETTPAAVEGKD